MSVMPRQSFHSIPRFGNYNEDQPSLFAVEFPFEFKFPGKGHLQFKIPFDVIGGSLPFLIGFPSLKAMGANLSFGNMTLGLKFFWSVL